MRPVKPSRTPRDQRPRPRAAPKVERLRRAALAIDGGDYVDASANALAVAYLLLRQAGSTREDAIAQIQSVVADFITVDKGAIPGVS